MLAIRMQRTGRKGHAMFRVIVQDSRRTPTSGNIVAQIGHYDPHTKAATLDKEKTQFYLEHGAQPSERIAQLIRGEKIKLPEWVAARRSKQGKVRNPEKLQKDLPKPTAGPTEAEVVESTEVAPEAEVATEEPEATEPAAEAEVAQEVADTAEATPEPEPVAELTEKVPDETPAPDKE
jgi:small subunit ribosomal protein S16